MTGFEQMKKVFYDEKFNYWLECQKKYNCPSTFGLPDTYENDKCNYGLDCEECWKRALELEIEVKE